MDSPEAPLNESQAQEPQDTASEEKSTKKKPNKWRRRLRRLFFLVCILLILLAGLYIYHKPILRSLGHYLVYQSPLQKADVIVVLSGGGSIRLEKGIELYRQDYAPRLMITIPKEPPKNALGYDGMAEEIRIYKAVLQLREISMDQVSWVPKQFFSTYSEGLFLKRWLNKNQYDSAIIVTGHFQSRRAKWTMEHIFPNDSYNIMIVPAENDEHFTPSNWWTFARGFITVENEYMKLLYYRIKSLFGQP